MMIFFVDVTDIISINFENNSFLPSKNLTKMIKLHQFLKIQDQFKVKNLED